MPQPDHIIKMPAVPDPGDLPDDIKKYFAICEEKLGMVPNVLRAYTGNLEKFRNFTAFYNNADSYLPDLQNITDLEHLQL